MFEQPHHDVRTALSVLPGMPLAGFFAMGELGPVGGRSFIHGHTIAFDSKGNLYVAETDMGRRIQKFSLGSPDADHVLALKTAPTGDLWIGTRAGAQVYSENRFQQVEGTQNVGITAILFGQEVFLGTDTGLVLRVKLNGTLMAENRDGGGARFIIHLPVRVADANAFESTS